MILFGGEGVEVNYPQVLNYDALPLASEQIGKIYIVKEPQGTWPVNRKRAGLWRSDGETWTRLGIAPTCEEIGADPAGSSATVQGNLNTHTVNENNPHSVTREQVGAMTYVNRGDPASHDFVAANFIKDTAWHDLDLSSIVPETAANKLIHLRIQVKSILVNYSINFRKKGNINEYNINPIVIQVAGVQRHEDRFVVCNSDRKIEYKVVGTNWEIINFLVKGWFKE